MIIEIITIWYCLPIDYFNDDGEKQYLSHEIAPNKMGVKIPLRILGTVWINLTLSYGDTLGDFRGLWSGYVVEQAQGNSNTAYTFDDDGMWDNNAYYYRNYIYMVLCTLLRRRSRVVYHL